MDQPVLMTEEPVKIRFVFDMKTLENGEVVETKFSVFEFASRADFAQQIEFVEPRGIVNFITTAGFCGISLSPMLYYYEEIAS